MIGDELHGGGELLLGRNIFGQVRKEAPNVRRQALLDSLEVARHCYPCQLLGALRPPRHAHNHAQHVLRTHVVAQRQRQRSIDQLVGIDLRQRLQVAKALGRKLRHFVRVEEIGVHLGGDTDAAVESRRKRRHLKIRWNAAAARAVDAADAVDGGGIGVALQREVRRFHIAVRDCVVELQRAQQRGHVRGAARLSHATIGTRVGELVDVAVE
mmetsp:Transcript_37725/g.92485  ORF Transcript_37725/g.92485 Transcript_37725/m.92485 type:complete len:212 (-) Transcript_37725:1687-2322(-)